MSRRKLQLVLVVGVMSLLGAVGVAVATGGRDVRERLTGYEEVPTLSSPANGEFTAHVNRFSETIEWQLSYRGFTTDVLQSHIHIGARATNGGISVWLCQRGQAAAPPGTAECPLREGTISGVIEPEDVIGPGAAPAQGIAAGEWEEFIDALRAGVTYANVHTTERTAGEIRAQLVDQDHRRW